MKIPHLIPTILLLCSLSALSCTKNTPDEPSVFTGIKYAGIPVVGGQLTFSAVGSGISRYSWDFGDGASSTAMMPIHTYTAIGSYTVSLTVDNTAATKKTLGVWVIAPPAVHPDFSKATHWRHYSYTHFSGGVKDTNAINTEDFTITALSDVTLMVKGKMLNYYYGTDSTAYYGASEANSTHHQTSWSLRYKSGTTDSIHYSVADQVSAGGIVMDDYYFP